MCNGREVYVSDTFDARREYLQPATAEEKFNNEEQKGQGKFVVVTKRNVDRSCKKSEHARRTSRTSRKPIEREFTTSTKNRFR